jgi:hypothetical protein
MAMGKEDKDDGMAVLLVGFQCRNAAALTEKQGV